METRMPATLWSSVISCLAIVALATGPGAARAISVDISASPQRVGINGASRISWTSSGAEWCWSRGSWGKERPLAGTFWTGPLAQNTWYGITCSDGEHEASDSVTVMAGWSQPQLSLDLSADRLRVDRGGSTTLRWHSSGAKWCWSRGRWGDERPLEGTFRTGRLDEKTWFGITCSDGERQVSDSVTVLVRDVSVTLEARPRQVRKGESTTITWNSSWATSCTAGGAWGGRRALKGSFWTGPIYKKKYYQLTCTNGKQSAFASITVQLAKTPVVRWQAPARNEDGSPLTDLAGFWFYWGTRSGHYTGRARIDTPNWTQYRPDHLTRGVYYVAVTAIDDRGNESAYSNEIRIWVP